MPSKYKIELLPLGRTLEIEAGAALQDVLFPLGVEFPCGGRGRCKGCRIKVLQGHIPVTSEHERILSAQELQAGWRLACRCQIASDLKIELAQWESAILSDDTAFAFTPHEGLGVAVDVGTTTLVVQLLDLETANVLGVRTALNPQARHGSDIMSRIDFGLASSGQNVLANLIREQIGGMIGELIQAAGVVASRLKRVVLAGNSVMHHFFCGIPIAPLAHHPFEPVNAGLQILPPGVLGAAVPASAQVVFLPCMGCFVGSDILAGVIATRLHESEELCALVDLGTNGEIVIGNRHKMLCASTAAGPAFEGARISMGMRAATGAISEVSWQDGALKCKVLGNTEPRGICGSGLVDAVTVAIEQGWIKLSGRMLNRELIPLAGNVTLNQADIRELQLAKGAIAAGIRLMLMQLEAQLNDVKKVYLAGAFGNYISRTSAQRIGLLNFPPEKIIPSGNTSLLGAKQALFDGNLEALHYRDILAKVTHTPLNEDELFQQIFAEEMLFPE